MFRSGKYFLLLILLLAGYCSSAQITNPPPPAADTVTEYEIIRGPSMRAIKIDSATTLQTIAGGAIIKQGNTIFKSDSAVVNPTTHELEAFGNIEINQADTLHTYSQYLKYLGTEKMAYLKDKVKLTNKSGTLTTNDLDYNLQTGIGNFHNGGKVVEGKSVITSVEGTYYDDTKDIYFKKNVKLDEPQKHIRADSLLYNMQTRKSSFISETYIKTPEVEINTTQGTYDLNTGNAFFTNRTTVKDSSGRLYSANTMALENKTGNAQLEGNAVIIDSAGGYTILSNQVYLNKKNNSFLATRKPVLIIKQKNDSTYVAADTIFSGFTTYVDNTNQVLQNDSTINVNVSENEKVHQVITHDSTAQYFENLEKEKRDSIQQQEPENEKLQEKVDSLKNENFITRETEIKKEVIDSLKRNQVQDSVKLKQEEIKPDSSHLDSLQVHKPEHIPDSTLADSSNKRSETDSIFLKKNIKDTSAKQDTSIRYFIAYHNVRIFNDSLQSICDSLFVSSKDSVFRLYYHPAVWSGSTQITGDTMFLWTENKEPKRLYVFENAMIVNRTREGFFNQMAGKTLNAYFINGKIDYVRVRGTQAESIYYLQDDDSAYIGMNHATGDVIDLYFKNEDLKKVIFINQIEGKMFPMKQIPAEEKQLRNFEWLDAKRPKNRAQLFE